MLATMLALIFCLYLGRTVLVPFAFSVLIAFILYPICAWLEKKGFSRLWAIIVTIVSVSLLVVGITFLFSAQIVDILKDLDDFTARLNEVLEAVTSFLNENVSIIPTIDQESLVNMGWKWMSNQSGGMLTNTLNRTALFVTGLTLTIIYSFLILLYRKGFKEAFISMVSKENQDKLAEMLSHMQKVGQQYLTGMFTLILILGALNSLGLFIIGIDYALFFGFLAGFLAIIPYVGTTVGGAIPAIYAFINHDSYWYPLAVILVFWFIQILEGNFLNPKIVGGNLNINPLASILVLILGGVIWGIPGMILFLPYTAILRVFSSYFDQLKPLAMFLRDDVSPQEKSSIKTKIGKFIKSKK